MKKLHKKILPLLGASFCFFSKQKESFFNFGGNSTEFCIEAKQEEKTNSTLENKEIQNFLAELNKKEVHLIVTKADKNILLLLHPEDRINSEQYLINDRHSKFLFKSSKTESKKILGSAYPGFNYSKLVKSNRYTLLAKALRNGKPYYINNLSGYKSICPVFFERDSAEEFLLKTSKESFKISKQLLPYRSNKTILKGILESKIITLGLGDFIKYYSLNPNDKALEKLEFLFVPSSQELNSKSPLLRVMSKNTYRTENFKFYQNKYQSLEAENKKV